MATTTPVPTPSQINDRTLTDSVAGMLTQLSRFRADLFVQQIANGHHDDDPFAPDGTGGVITYADRKAQLDESEQRLRLQIAPSIFAAAWDAADLATPTS